MTTRPALPPPPAPLEPPAFPVLGALAPLLVAAVLFAATRSPAVLLFAVFSPVLAVAAVLDGRLQLRRRSRRERRRRAALLEALGREVDDLRGSRVTALRRAHPGIAVLASGAQPGDGIVLGTADLPGEPVLEGRPADEAERALITRAGVLPDAPVVVPSGTTVVVSGLEPFAGAAARAVRAQQREAMAGADAVELEVTGPDTARVVRATGAAASLSGLVLRPDYLTAASAAVLPDTAARPVPALADLLPDAVRARGALGARFLLGDGGPVEIDLVEHGPHAVVVGTTGSGKSALLTAWVVALAAAHPPDRMALLLVDCKGGAAFDPVAALPHVTGVLTDLDPAGVDRAVASLTAEMARRERVLRAAGVADIGRTGEARLVVLVDEFRALLDRAPALAAVFADVAARGRSLGVHLVLCTQRAGGAIRDDLLANCGLRIALRVTDGADSSSLVGTDAAARLARTDTGAAVLGVAGDRPVGVHICRVDPDVLPGLVLDVAARHPAVRAPACWLPPLPARLPAGPLIAEAEPGQVVLGRLDLPEEQAQPVLAWRADRRPNLIIVGDGGSGRSTALSLVARQLGSSIAPADPAGAWDRVHDDARPLLIDDLETLVESLGAAHGAALLEAVVRRMRTGRTPVVLSVRPPSGWAGVAVRPLLGLADATLVLGTGLDDHLALGFDRSAWRRQPHPGAAFWQGRIAQIALPGIPGPRDAPPASPVLSIDSPTVLVSRTPEARTHLLRSAGIAVLAPDEWSPDVDGPVVVAGAPGTWQTHWALLGRLALGGNVLIDRVDPADVRALLGRRDLLPPVAHPEDVILVPPEGVPERRRLPGIVVVAAEVGLSAPA